MKYSIKWLCCCLLLCLMACSKPAPEPFQLIDITGSRIANQFVLQNTQGKNTQLSDYSGKVVLLFFGFTHCPDVCPSTLFELKKLLASLTPADQTRVQVIFITLDPERDSPAQLQKYVQAFDPRFVALHTSLEKTAVVAKDFNIFYEKQAAENGQYTVDHTAGVTIYDAEGQARLFYQPSKGLAALQHDVKILLDNK